VVEVPHCELYDPPYNQHRIGCILCPMSSAKQKMRDIELYPHVKQKWLEVFEYFIGGGGYDPGYSYGKRTKSSDSANTGGATYHKHNPAKFKEMAVQLRDRSECTGNGQTKSAPPATEGLYARRNHPKRQAPMESRGKFVGPGAFRLVAYA